MPYPWSFLALSAIASTRELLTMLNSLDNPILAIEAFIEKLIIKLTLHDCGPSAINSQRPLKLVNGPSSSSRSIARP